MSYRVKFTTEVALPLLKPRRDGIDGIDMECVGVLPFVPHPGMMIAPLKGDDFREVAIVYWMAESPDELEVHFELDEASTVANMKAAGWRETP